MKNGQERRREKEKERGRDGGRKKRRTEGGKEEKNEAIRRVPHVFWMKVASVISARAHRLTVYDTMYVPGETV